MYKKKLCLVSFVLVLALVSSASAVNYHWWKDANSQNSNWNTPDNWDSGLVPATAYPSDAFIGDASTGTVNPAVVDGSQPCANSQWLTVGFNWWGGLDVIAGGQMGTTIWGPGELFVGAHGMGDGNAYGVINIDGAGSTLQAEGWRIGNAPHGGIGIVNITNGGSMIGGWWGMRIGPTGTVNIIDGTMHVWGTSEPMSMLPGSLIDISTGAMLTLDTDQTALTAGYIASGYITGDGIVGNLTNQFNPVTGFTEVFVPEPATVLLLGLGGLLLRKRLA
jgi:hypothetical protein